MPYLVYLATCKASGKVYVGCTAKSLRERREQHHLSAVNGSPHKFHKALRELGLSSFEWTVLGTATSKAAMFAMERSCVARYNSYRSGYNSTPGGQGSASDGMASRRKMPIKTPYPSRPRALYTRR